MREEPYIFDMSSYIRLGVNIDHVATLRNARGGVHPDPFAVAQVCVKAGALTSARRMGKVNVRPERFTTAPLTGYWLKCGA